MADLERQLARFERRLPRPVGCALAWLTQPRGRWVRVPVALLLIVGGCLGFLPALGFWMVPLGLALVAKDVPFLQPPMARALAWINRKWKPRARRHEHEPAAKRLGAQ